LTFIFENYLIIENHMLIVHIVEKC